MCAIVNLLITNCLVNKLKLLIMIYWVAMTTVMACCCCILRNKINRHSTTIEPTKCSTHIITVIFNTIHEGHLAVYNYM